MKIVQKISNSKNNNKRVFEGTKTKIKKKKKTYCGQSMVWEHKKMTQ